MGSSLFTGSILFLLLCTFTPTLGSSKVNVYGAGEVITFSRTPVGYNNETGAFTLGEQLTCDAGNGAVCVMYDYFIFNAQAGQVLHGHLQTTGTARPVYFAVLNSPYQLYSFQNSNCGIGNWGPMQKVSAASMLNWTAPKNGQYALLFMTNGFYSGTVYFTQ
jgi:hypothetical protein